MPRDFTERVDLEAVGGVLTPPTQTPGAVPAEIVSAPGLPGSSVANVLLVDARLVEETNRLLRKLIMGLELYLGNEFPEPVD